MRACLHDQMGAVWMTPDDAPRTDASATFTDAMRLKQACFNASSARFSVAK